MAFRTVKISSRAKLELELNYLVIRNENVIKVCIEEISLLILENQQIVITNALLAKLVENKVRIIFCDSNHNPIGELEPYSLSYNSSSKIKTQFNWEEERKMICWTLIVKQKIFNQVKLLSKLNKKETANKLIEYYKEIEINDSTNREGLSAKLYFCALYGNNFERRSDLFVVNKYLNYGYSILLSAINREISSFGYLNGVGIHHIGETNPFNLGCDFIEPFRPFIDEVSLSKEINEDNYKKQMIEVLEKEISCNNNKTILVNAIHFYVQSIFTFLKGGDSNICEVTFLDE